MKKCGNFGNEDPCGMLALLTETESCEEKAIKFCNLCAIRKLLKSCVERHYNRCRRPNRLSATNVSSTSLSKIIFQCVVLGNINHDSFLMVFEDE